EKDTDSPMVRSMIAAETMPSQILGETVVMRYLSLRLSARQQRPRAHRMPSAQTATDPPRVRDIEATYIVDGQDGRLAWGRSSSTAANTQEPFAWAIASDNKTIVGADMDGYFRITLISPDSKKSATPTTVPARPMRSSPPAT